MYKQVYHIGVFVLAFLLSCCVNSSQTNRDEYVLVKDLKGREVLVPKNVKKIVGLRAGALRLLIYMDAIDLIAGIEDVEKKDMRPYTLAHPELLELPIIGPSMGGDAELILKAHPDVIFISYSTKGDADALQKKTGIPVIVLECPELGTARDTLFASFRLIGKVLHKENRANSLISYIENSIAELNAWTQDIPDREKPSVYIGGVSYSGAHGINSIQPYYPPFIFINAHNVSSGIDKRLVSHVKGTYIDKEQLIRWNPDVLFIDASGLSLVQVELAENTVLNKSLTAVKQNRMYVLLPYNNYATNYELVLINAWYTGKVLYPDRFADITIRQKANEILKNFLGVSVYDEIVKTSAALRQLEINDF